MEAKMRRIVVTIALPAVLFFGGCGGSTVESPVDNNGEAAVEKTDPPADSGMNVVQGLTEAERDFFFRTSMGSDLFPVPWLKALTRKDGSPFLDNVERFGLIADPSDPSGLPIGLTVDPDPRGVRPAIPMVGVSCAACHVGRATAKGKSILLIGAPNLFDLNAFYSELFERASMDPAAFVKFLGKVAENEARKVGEKAGGLFDGLGDLLGKAEDKLKTGEKTFSQKWRELARKIDESVKNPELLRHYATDSIDAMKDTFNKLHQTDFDELIEALKNSEIAEGSLKEFAALKDGAGDRIREIMLDFALFKARLQYLKDLNKLHQGEMGGKTLPEPGPGRIDAFDGIRDLVFPDDVVPPTAPVSFPHLWQVKQTIWFHWDDNTNSLMQRNIGQAVGMGAVFDPKTFSSTVKPANIDKLEKTLNRLDAPRWPAAEFGAIDLDAAKRGEQIYAKNCVECHKLYPTEKIVFDPAETVEARNGRIKNLAIIVDLAKIGTDPNRVNNFAINVGRAADGSGGKPFAQALAQIAANLEKQAFIDNNISKSDQLLMDLPESLVKWPTNHGYSARPLVSIWATAPYLHNASVPTIRDLLDPPDKRPKSFYVGYREYDPVKLGYVSDEEHIPADVLNKPPIFKFEVVSTKNGVATPVEGNSNAGHVYGVDLSEQEKKDLIEYLKKL
jgi:hypothetical protein